MQFETEIYKRLRHWLDTRAERRLYKMIWKANTIILRERYGWLSRERNKPYWDDLDKCAALLRNTATEVFKSYGVK